MVKKKHLFLLLCLWMAFSLDIMAQGKLVTVNFKNTEAAAALQEIEKQSGMKMQYSYRDLNFKVNYATKNADAVKVVKDIVEPHGFTVKVEKNYLRISRKQGEKGIPGILRRIFGKVVDENRDPLIGATVKVSGKNIFAVADKDGNFSIDGVSNGDKLEVSYVGMKSVTVPAKDGEIVLKEDNTLDDVIVTGYGTYKRGEYVGAVNQIRADDIKIEGEATIDQMLQGVIPGLAVINTTGKVGGTPKVRIRGTSTLLGNQEPLWVVDDVIQTNPLPIPNNASPLSGDMTDLAETAGNAISWLNPSDIETITVLKDASSTAIYGSQASNGVIVITTKKAKQGNFNVNYSGNVSISQAPSYGMYDMMTSREYMQFNHEMWKDRNSYTQAVLPVAYAGILQKLQRKEISQEEFEHQFRMMENTNTDWFDILFHNALSTQHNVSVSSNRDKLSSRFSIGVNNTMGDAKGNDMFSLTTNMTTTYRPSKKLIIDFSMNGTLRKSRDFAYGVDPYSYAMNTTRAIPAYQEDGTYFYHEKFGRQSYSIPNKLSYNYNILNEIENTGRQTLGNNFQSSLSVKWFVVPHLQFQGFASLGLNTRNVKQWATEYSNYITSIRGYEYGYADPNSVEEQASVLPFGGLLQNNNINTTNYSFRGALVYTNVFNDKHSVTLNLGAQASSNRMKGERDMHYGYLKYRGETFAAVPTDITATPELSKNPADLHREMQRNTAVTNTLANQLSEYITAVYSFDNRYVLNLNTRLDASNRFGQDNNHKFNPTFSLGGKWRIGEEHWMESARGWFDMLDLSFSYGWRGNAVTEVSPFLIARDGGMHPYYYQYYLNLVSLPYPDLGWEKTKDWNIGVEMSFFNSRVSANFNYYNKKSNVLAAREVPVEYGEISAYIDGTEMLNNGYELIVSVVPVRTKDWTWSMSFNTSKDFNKVKNNTRVNTPEDYLYGTAIIEGEPYGTFYVYDFTGLDPATGKPSFKNLQSSTYMGWQRVGTTLGPKYEVVGEAPETFEGYLVKGGCTQPDVTGGFNTMLRYKNVSLRAQFAMSLGGQKYLPTFYATSGSPRPELNVPRYMLNRWRKSGDELTTDIPSIPMGNPQDNQVTLEYGNGSTYVTNIYEMYNTSTARVADDDFIRCRSISLQFDMPKTWIQKIGMKKAYLTFNVVNPFVITFDKKWDGRDPETGGWPARKAFTLSLNANF